MTSPNNDNDPVAADAAANQGCPICEKSADAAYLPFCSKRCADVDLHRWLSGGYGIPATEEDDSAVEE